uniref:Ribonuclease H-like domain-containing protein n=1 Tax=Tanacetum cinerariifolium TaxID=118510 RepID=A0A699HG03_TANCI|nr:ribonuclease H-like domain-containing protein [Tanacetum cinerariifolium]
MVRSMWLFKHKFHADGTLSRYKARLVANGSSRKIGVDFDETFSPVVKPATIRTVLSLVVSRKWPIHQLDVKNAFLNGDLSETVYMHQPPGFVDARFIFVSEEVCLYMHNSRGPHFAALKRILRYVRGIVDFGLQLYASATTSLVGYTDVDWAGCPSTRRSGYCVFPSENLLSWPSKRQHTLSRSRAKAKYRGVANVVAKTAWLRNLLRGLHSPLSTSTLVYYDNYADIFTKGLPLGDCCSLPSEDCCSLPPEQTAAPYLLRRHYSLVIASGPEVARHPSYSSSSIGSGGLFTAASSAVALAASIPFAARPYIYVGVDGRIVASCDARPTSPILNEDYLTGLRTASQTIFRHDTLNYITKEYSMGLKPAFKMKSFALTTIKSFVLNYFHLLIPNVEDDDNDFEPDEHHVDLVIPFKKSIKQILCQYSVVTTRFVLERFAVHRYPHRVAWKLLKDVPKSALRKSNREMPFYIYTVCVGRTTFRGHFLGVAASWLVEVGIECYHCVRNIVKSKNKGEDADVVAHQGERAKVLGKRVCGVTVRCGASLVFASIGAGIGATLFRPTTGQSYAKHHTTRHACLICF